jgi:hypothetical protein
MPTRSVLLDVRLFTLASGSTGGMDQSAIEGIMQRAVAAVGQQCCAQISAPNLQTSTAGGWWQIGTVLIPGEWIAWLVYWHPELERGWLWGIRWNGNGATPRRFESRD